MMNENIESIDTPKHHQPSDNLPAQEAEVQEGYAGVAQAIGEQCDDIEKKRVEQTDKMRLLLLKLGRMDKPKTSAVKS